MLKGLLVDDQVDLLKSLKLFLYEYDIKVETCKDGNDALDMIETGMYDFYLLDVDLPGINGLTLAKLARQKAKKKPIIMFTGFSMWYSEEELIEAGADRVLEKGDDDFMVIVNTIRELCGVSDAE